MPLLLTKVTLLLLSVYGWYALFSFGYRNGFLAMVSAQRETGRLGSHQILYNPSFIGIPRVDQHLNVLLTFFWPLVDGSRPDASLHSFYFAGQGIAIWIATSIESLRAGNQGHVVSLLVETRQRSDLSHLLTCEAQPCSVSAFKPSEWLS